MLILSLDQALKTTGYAVFDNDKLVSHGTFTIKSSLPIEARLMEIQKQLCKIWQDSGVEVFDKIVFEDIQQQHGDVATYKKLAYVQASIMLWCYNEGIKFEIMAPSHWRKILGGGFGRNREEQKLAAKNYVYDKYGIAVSSDEADAIAIGSAYIKEVL